MVLRRGAIWRGDDDGNDNGDNGDGDAPADAALAEAVAEGAGVGARRVVIRRLAARARISFMRSMVYAPFPSISHRCRIARI
jgi:hypothetical protein